MTGGAVVSEAGRCARARLDMETALWLLDLPGRARVRLSTQTTLAGRIYLAHEGGPSRPMFPQFEAGTAKDVVIPVAVDARPWTLGVDSPLAPGTITACILVPTDVPLARTPRATVRSQT